MKKALFLLIVLGTTISLHSQSLINQENSLLQFFGEFEGGAVKVLYHTYQSGSDGTNFNYVTQGGQEILFPFSRIKAGFTLAERHMFNVLYQPLVVETEATFRDDVTINGITFASGTPMDIKYGFSFWRFTYGFDFFNKNNFHLYGGASLQFRNASLVFSEKTGDQSTTNQNLGLVPALFLAAEYTFPKGISLGFEATGFYASSAFFNGADFQFEGSILDASLRVLFPLKDELDTFINIRFLGGTSDGVSQYENRFWTQSVETYTQNNLATLSVTAGLRIK